MIAHPSVAGAAVLAGLLVAGGSYAARHDMGLGSGLPASADARMKLEHELRAGYLRHHRHHPHLLSWHAPHVPKIHVHHQTAPQAMVFTTAAPAAAPVASAAPVATSAPVTRTSPVGGGDDGSGDE